MQSLISVILVLLKYWFYTHLFLYNYILFVIFLRNHWDIRFKLVLRKIKNYVFEVHVYVEKFIPYILFSAV